LKVLLSGLLYTGISVGIILGLYYLFEGIKGTKVGDGFIVGIGSVGSSICLALGFVPQIYEMCKTKSSEGFSLGVTFLDIVGGLLSIATVFLHGAVDLGGLLPYVIIIGCQVSVAVVMPYCDGGFPLNLFPLLVCWVLLFVCPACCHQLMVLVLAMIVYPRPKKSVEVSSVETVQTNTHNVKSRAPPLAQQAHADSSV